MSAQTLSFHEALDARLKAAAPESPVRALATWPGVTTLEPGDVDAFIAADAAPFILFFSGEAKKRPEAQDVAVVLREMLRARPGTLRVGLMSSAAEDKLKSRFGVAVLPSVVFMQGETVLETIGRIQDWTVYEDAARRHLDI
jgi:hydrogenase-1 operon protein HyaE